MPYAAHSNYKNAAIATADRGKLVVMVYDHCIQWCDHALEAGTDLAKRSQAIDKVQAGLTELTCALDMERGGDISRNLWRLYDFMTWTLTQCVVNRTDKGIPDVRRMLSELRAAWQMAADEVRRSQPDLVAGQGKPMALFG
ncbi:MAG TPA: flagellar export chaperone FliS [Fibrobacteria bacterium]|nr:flagellar export chaperone FliS [Fibrobacteria bacterium]